MSMPRAILTALTFGTAFRLGAQTPAPLSPPATTQDTAEVYLAAIDLLADSLGAWLPGKAVRLHLVGYSGDSAYQARLLRAIRRAPFSGLCQAAECPSRGGVTIGVGPLRGYGQTAVTVSVGSDVRIRVSRRAYVGPDWAPTLWREALAAGAAAPTMRPVMTGGCGPEPAGLPVVLVFVRAVSGRWEWQYSERPLRLCA